MNRARIPGDRDELRPIGRETHPGGKVAVRVFQFGDGAARRSFFEMDHPRRHFKRHQLAIRSEGDIPGEKGTVPRHTAAHRERFQIVKGKRLVPGNDQFAIVRSEKDSRSPTHFQVLDQPAAGRLPDFHMLRMPATGRHSFRLRGQRNIGHPPVRHDRSVRRFRSEIEEHGLAGAFSRYCQHLVVGTFRHSHGLERQRDPMRSSDLPATLGPGVRFDTPALQAIEWPARQQFATSGREQRDRSVAHAQPRDLPTARDIPQAHTVRSSQGQKGAVGTDVSFAKRNCAVGKSVEERAILLARDDSQKLRLIVGRPNHSRPPAVAAETKPSWQSQPHQQPPRQRLP